MTAIINPPLTQWLPVVGNERVAYDIRTFLQSLPAFQILDVSFLPVDHQSPVTAGPGIKLRYSYIIHPEGDPSKKYNEGLRRNLREAAPRYTIAASSDITLFLSLCRQTYEHRGMKPPGWFDHIIPKIIRELTSRNAGALEMAVDGKGQAIAGILTGYDHARHYYIAGGKMSDDSGISAHALLLDHAVRRAAGEGRIFDFEGSMHPGIANFFQSFGARPEAYWNIRKYRGAGKLWALFH